MTDQAFITLLNMSLTAGYVILALVLVRLLFRRAPKQLLYGLWALPLFRLVCPVSVDSVLSLLPSAQPIPTDITYQAVPAIRSGIPALNAVVNPVLAQAAPEAVVSVNPLQVWCFVGKAIWLVGVTVLLCYAVASYARLRHSLRFTVRENGVWRGEAVAAPMVLGLFRPQVYLPLHVEGEACILGHERAHIARGDHIVKPLAYLVLCLHWFNPLVWLAYTLMCKDMEGACDERVLQNATPAQRKEYAACLFHMGVRRSRLAVPLAFGESDTAGRIKRVLNYKKPAFWFLVVLALAAAALCVTLLTNPAGTSLGIIGGADGPTQIYLGSNQQSGSPAIIGGADGPTDIYFSGKGEYNYGIVLGEDGVTGVNLANLVYHRLTGEEPAFAHGLSEADLAQLPLIPWVYLDSNVEIAVIVSGLPVEELRISDTLLRPDGSIQYQDGEGGPLVQEGALTQEDALAAGARVFTYTLEPSQWALLSSSYGPHDLYRCFSVQYRVGEQWNECCFVLHTQESVVKPGEVLQGEDEKAPAFITPAEAARRYGEMRRAWPAEQPWALEATGDWDGDGKTDHARFIQATGQVQVRFGDGAALSPSPQDLMDADYWGGNMQLAGADVNGDGKQEVLLCLDMGGQGGDGAYILLAYREADGQWGLLPSPGTGPVYQVYWEADTDTVRIACEETGYEEYLADESLVAPYVGGSPEERAQRIAWMEGLGSDAVSTGDPISAFQVTEEGHILTRQYLTAPGGSHAEQYGYMLTEYAYTAADELAVVSAWFVPVPAA